MTSKHIIFSFLIILIFSCSNKMDKRYPSKNNLTWILFNLEGFDIYTRYEYENMKIDFDNENSLIIKFDKEFRITDLSFTRGNDTIQSTKFVYQNNYIFEIQNNDTISRYLTNNNGLILKKDLNYNIKFDLHQEYKYDDEDRLIQIKTTGNTQSEAAHVHPNIDIQYTSNGFISSENGYSQNSHDITYTANHLIKSLTLYQNNKLRSITEQTYKLNAKNEWFVMESTTVTPEKNEKTVEAKRHFNIDN